MQPKIILPLTDVLLMAFCSKRTLNNISVHKKGSNGSWTFMEINIGAIWLRRQRTSIKPLYKNKYRLYFLLIGSEKLTKMIQHGATI